MAPGSNGSCCAAGRRHHHEDRKRLEETQHSPALPGKYPPQFYQNVFPNYLTKFSFTIDIWTRYEPSAFVSIWLEGSVFFTGSIKYVTPSREIGNTSSAFSGAYPLLSSFGIFLECAKMLSPSHLLVCFGILAHDTTQKEHWENNCWRLLMRTSSCQYGGVYILVGCVTSTPGALYLDKLWYFLLFTFMHPIFFSSFACPDKVEDSYCTGGRRDEPSVSRSSLETGIGCS